MSPENTSKCLDCPQHWTLPSVHVWNSSIKLFHGTLGGNCSLWCINWSEQTVQTRLLKTFCMASAYGASWSGKILPTDPTSLTPRDNCWCEVSMFSTSFSMCGCGAAEHIEDWWARKVKREEGLTFTPYSSLAFSQVMLAWLIIMLKCFVEKVSAAVWLEGDVKPLLLHRTGSEELRHFNPQR